MGCHAVTVNPAENAPANSYRPCPELAELDLSNWPIIGQRLPPELHHRFWCYSREASQNGYADDPLSMTEAAEQVIECVQRELREREGNIDRAAGIELFLAQWWALHALRDAYGNKFAKETQLRLSDDRPLAVCVGGGKVEDVETEAGVAHVTAVGCFRAFSDSTRTTGGEMWPKLCPDCRPSRGKRQPRRDETRAVVRRAKSWASEWDRFERAEGS